MSSSVSNKGRRSASKPRNAFVCFLSFLRLLSKSNDLIMQASVHKAESLLDSIAELIFLFDSANFIAFSVSLSFRFVSSSLLHLPADSLARNSDCRVG